MVGQMVEDSLDVSTDDVAVLRGIAIGCHVVFHLNWLSL